MNQKRVVDALALSAKSGFVSGLVTMLYGYLTKDYTQVVPAIIFSFGTAMSVSGYYDRRMQRLGLG
jgi:hypothetical protein